MKTSNAVLKAAMEKWKYVIILVFSVPLCGSREPFKPRDGSLPFLVYFMSRYRGLCVGILVSRTAVMTASVCITDPTVQKPDTRPINVVTGATYRHPRRGIRVQVTKIIIPKLSNVSGDRGYMIQQSPAILLLARKVPDVLAEIPLRPVEVDYKGEEPLALHEECLVPGWHFFYKGDKIFPVHKFLLQRNIRVQYLVVVKKSLWCNTITLKFQKAMTNLGYTGYFDKTTSICVRDPGRTAQPCHVSKEKFAMKRSPVIDLSPPDMMIKQGMYGAPLICRGKAFAMLMAPDAQWANCTGYSNLVQLLSSSHIQNFMNCVSGLFEPEFSPSWDSLKKSLESEPGDHQFDYLPDLYDRMMYDLSSSEEV